MYEVIISVQVDIQFIVDADDPDTALSHALVNYNNLTEGHVLRDRIVNKEVNELPPTDTP